MHFKKNINYTQFYIACKAKGVKITSELTGVHIKLQLGGLVFQAQAMTAGKTITRRFPFDKFGEIACHKFYLDVSSQNPETRGKNSKRTIKD